MHKITKITLVLKIRCMWKSRSDSIFYNIILCIFVETQYIPEFCAVWWFFFVLLVYCVGVRYAGSGGVTSEFLYYPTCWINVRISADATCWMNIRIYAEYCWANIRISAELNLLD